jgi:hypothetical protein
LKLMPPLPSKSSCPNSLSLSALVVLGVDKNSSRRLQCSQGETAPAKQVLFVLQ